MDAETLELAYLSFAVANSYDAPMLAAAQAAAAAGNAKLDRVRRATSTRPPRPSSCRTPSPRASTTASSSSRCSAPASSRASKQAIAAGIAIGNIDQILGSDKTTADPQVEGLWRNVVFVPSELGRKIGELVVQACAEPPIPCNVGYIYSVKAAALDTTLQDGFDEATAGNPEIKVVAEGESFYTTALGLKASQDMLPAHPDLDVIVGADQAITGAVQAVADVNLQGQVKLVGYGGGTIAFQDIASGERFGTVMQVPATEGRLGVSSSSRPSGRATAMPGVDPLACLPDGGVVTKANVETFLTLAEWPG